MKKIKSPKTIDELLALWTIVSENETEPNGLHKGLILGITACAAAIAHTYMAAEAINKKANELGYESKVEKKGANGIEDRITQNDINQTVGIILAHD